MGWQPHSGRKATGLLGVALRPPDPVAVFIPILILQPGSGVARLGHLVGAQLAGIETELTSAPTRR
jgi:hypothetical protein